MHNRDIVETKEKLKIPYETKLPLISLMLHYRNLGVLYMAFSGLGPSDTDCVPFLKESLQDWVQSSQDLYRDTGFSYTDRLSAEMLNKIVWEASFSLQFWGS